MPRSRTIVNTAITQAVSRSTNTACLGSVICGGTAFLSSLTMGPIGLLIGSALGGFLAYISTYGRFRSLTSIIQNLLPSERTVLLNSLATVTNARQYTWRDFIILLEILTNPRRLFSSTVILSIVLKVIRLAQRA